MPDNEREDEGVKRRLKDFCYQLNKFPDLRQVLSVSNIRDIALRLFNGFISFEAGYDPDVSDASIEEKREFLSDKEVTSIIEEHAFSSNSVFMAVGGDTKDEAEDSLRKLLNALCQRILSNVIAHGVKEELIDVAFDSDKNDFVFSASQKGENFVSKFENEFGKKDSDDQ